MNVWPLALRAMRSGLRWWWAQARPGIGADLRGEAVARPAHETGRPPTPQERWLPATQATGAWEHVDPHAAGPWPRRGSLLAVAVWGTLVGLRVRRELRGRTSDQRTDQRTPVS